SLKVTLAGTEHHAKQLAAILRDLAALRTVIVNDQEPKNGRP
ncbi:MAG: hypothetical protein ACI9G1_001698, partial [Pirellulaceae bacterium]